MEHSSPSPAELRQENHRLRQRILELENQVKSLGHSTGDQPAEDEKFFKLLADASMGAIYIFQEEAYQYVNQAFLRMSGYTREEIDRLHYLELLHPDHREFIKAATEQALTGETDDLPQEPELRIVRKDGEQRWVRFLPTIVQYRGKPAILANAMDITSQKTMEEWLQTQRRQYRDAIESVDQAICLLDEDETISYINSIGADLLGYPASDIPGKPFAGFLGQDAPENISSRLGGLQTGKSVTFDCTVITGEGTSRIVRMIFRPMRDKQDRYLGAFGKLMEVISRPASSPDGHTSAGDSIRREHTPGHIPAFLTICASCKRIKETDESWHPPESYFLKQLQIDFSHSICPECMEKLYPGFLQSGE